MATPHRLARFGAATYGFIATRRLAQPYLNARWSSSAPMSIVDRELWKSLVPKPLRRENRSQVKAKYKEWNPATYFIVMFLFIGSMSIQMIALRTQFDKYVRQSSARIGLLREVVERIQRGEDVDVEQVLGTGEPQKEADWEEVLQAIDRDDKASKNHKQPDEKLSESQEAPCKASETFEAPLSRSSGTSANAKKAMGFGSFC